MSGINTALNNDAFFYRYESVEYATLGVDGDFVSKTYRDPKVELRVFNLWKETEKGHWVGYGKPHSLHSKGKWVSKTSKKRYAYPTKEEALINFIKRNERRVKILSAQLESCEVSISKAKQIQHLEAQKKQ